MFWYDCSSKKKNGMTMIRIEPVIMRLKVGVTTYSAKKSEQYKFMRSEEIVLAYSNLIIKTFKV